MREWRVAGCCAVGVVVLLSGSNASGAAPAPSTTGQLVVRGALGNWSRTPGIEGLERAFEYLARTDLAALPIGRTAIEGDDVYVTVSEAETLDPGQVRWEAHRRYVDIQLVVQGQEAMAVAPVAGLVTSAPYDPAKDVEFFEPPAGPVILGIHAGEFAVFAPGTAHRPSLHLDGPHVSRKAVVKVSVAYRDRQRAAGR